MNTIRHTKAWSFQHLPIVPQKWRLNPTTRGKQQISVIRKLLAKADSVVIATDPDREGEVIAREVLDELGYRGHLSRLLLSALDPASIRKGLDSIRDGSETEKLYQAGMGRARADWLVGMNLTRAYTLLGRQQGDSGVRSVGRVQTPTLALIVRRDAEIANFAPTDFWMIEAECINPEHEPFSAVWVPNAEQREALCDSEGRCIIRVSALHLAQELTGQAGLVSQSKKERKRIKPPLPFSLSGLQQVTSKRFGYGAKETLDDLPESVRKTHKADHISLGPTASYLPESQIEEVPAVMAGLKQTFSGENMSQAIAGADPAMKSRAWNDKKITAHHGMIPVPDQLAS